jgi:hypothetical protein
MDHSEGITAAPLRRRGAGVPVAVAFLLGILLGVLPGALVGLFIPHPWRPAGGAAGGRAGAAQEGTATVPSKDASPDGIEVYYSVPYLTPPHLEFPSGLGKCVVVEQTASKFKLKNTWPIEERVHWKAGGQPSR